MLGFFRPMHVARHAPHRSSQTDQGSDLRLRTASKTRFEKTAVSSGSALEKALRLYRQTASAKNEQRESTWASPMRFITQPQAVVIAEPVWKIQKAFVSHRASKVKVPMSPKELGLRKPHLAKSDRREHRKNSNRIHERLIEHALKE